MTSNIFFNQLRFRSIRIPSLLSFRLDDSVSSSTLSRHRGSWGRIQMRLQHVHSFVHLKKNQNPLILPKKIFENEEKKSRKHENRMVFLSDHRPRRATRRNRNMRSRAHAISEDTGTSLISDAQLGIYCTVICSSNADNPFTSNLAAMCREPRRISYYSFLPFDCGPTYLVLQLIRLFQHQQQLGIINLQQHSSNFSRQIGINLCNQREELFTQHLLLFGRVSLGQSRWINSTDVLQNHKIKHHGSRP
jgi:hypothetical protein